MWIDAHFKLKKQTIVTVFSIVYVMTRNLMTKFQANFLKIQLNIRASPMYRWINFNSLSYYVMPKQGYLYIVITTIHIMLERIIINIDHADTYEILYKVLAYMEFSLHILINNHNLHCCVIFHSIYCMLYNNAALLITLFASTHFNNVCFLSMIIVCISANQYIHT
jgi:hypothetical protein